MRVHRAGGGRDARYGGSGSWSGIFHALSRASDGMQRCGHISLTAFGQRRADAAVMQMRQTGLHGGVTGMAT